MLQVISARAEDGATVGWCVYLLDGAGVSKVLQMGARPAMLRSVVDAVRDHAKDRGSHALVGRLEPHLMTALSGRPHLVTSLREYFMVVHSKDEKMLAAVHRGDAFLTELEGEWVTAFHQEPSAGYGR